MPSRHQRLRIETDRHHIEGTLQLPSEGYRSRTKDFFDAHVDSFIALTDVELRPFDGTASERYEFLAVSVRHAVIVIELGAVDEGHSSTEQLQPIGD